MKKYAFGVDLGGTTIKIGLFQTNGALIDKWEIPTRKEEKGIYILDDISSALENKIQEMKITKEEVEGIGMGVPGPVDANGTIYKCVNLGWEVFNARKVLEKKIGLKVKTGNDANVAALGEMWQGGGKGCKNIVMVTLGTGVGGGIIIDGKILPGINGAAGEIGHIPVNEEEMEYCGCGKRGCLEQYASATGVYRSMKKYLKENPEIPCILREKKVYTTKDIFDAARNGDQAAGKIVDDTGLLLGKIFASISCVINPDAFVVGGGMSKAGDILFHPIRKHYEKYAFHATKETKIYCATLGNDAGIYGGVRMVIDQ